MFQFPAFASYPYVFKIRYLFKDSWKDKTFKINVLNFPGIKGGFPHSEIHGSKLIRSSPQLIAAYHVLHRLCMPRHPPNALLTLDCSHCQCPSLVVLIPYPFRLRSRGTKTFHPANQSKQNAISIRSKSHPTVQPYAPAKHPNPQ